MTVSDPYVDDRKSLRYAITIRYGATNSLVEVHRYPTQSTAIAAAEELRAAWAPAELADTLQALPPIAAAGIL